MHIPPLLRSFVRYYPMPMAMAMPHILRRAAPPIFPGMCVPPPKIGAVNHGVSFGSACQLLQMQTSQLLILQSSQPKKLESRGVSVSVRCEQSTEGSNSVDLWLGRIAMLGFATAITVEITTGKGLLENFGLTAPLPTVALALTMVVGVLTAFFIFQSASKD